MQGKPIPPAVDWQTLVVAPQIFGAGSLLVGADRQELLDASHELRCDHLPVDACGCGDA